MTNTKKNNSKGVIIMDSKRAKEICVSKEMAHVTYEGSPIYIEKVNENKDTASIHFLNRPEYSQEVHLTHLVDEK